MSINKKIMMFCAVSLIAICVFLADRGTASKENENKESTVQEHVSTGAAIISSVSASAVREEDRMDGEKKEDTSENEAGMDDGGTSATDVTEEKNDDSGKRSEKEQPTETKSLNASDRKKDQTTAADKKGLGRKKNAGTSFRTHRPAGNEDAATTSAPVNPHSTADVEKNECELQIVCSDVLKHMDKLKDSVKKVIPADGIILDGRWSFTDGDTVFDVLKKACADKNILIDYVFTPGFSTYYVKGINQLYEFDCGDESGWMYTVNGKKPDYGCSQYEVKKNDKILFYYTCER